MKYTDISKQQKIYVKRANEKNNGIAKVFLLIGILIFIGIVFFFFKDSIKKAFNPIKIVGGSSQSKTNLKQSDGRTNILVLGSDKRSLGIESGRNTLTDTILVASIGKVDNDVVLISLPRDLWINNYKLENGYTYSSKINEVYANSSVEELKIQMENVLDIPIHYYATVTFQLFEEIIDTLEGVDINVEKSFTDYEYPVEGKEGDFCGKTEEEKEEITKKIIENGGSYTEDGKTINFLTAFPCRYETISFNQGVQKMDGKTALKYARSRHGNNGEGSDFARSKRQQGVIMAIKNKALSVNTLLNPIKLKEIYNQYVSNVETDIDLQDIQSFYQLSQDLSFEDIKSIVIDTGDNADEGGLLYHPTDSTLYGGAWVLVPQAGDFSQIHAYVQKYLFGNK